MGGNVSFIAFSVFARQLIAVTFEGLCRFVPNLTCAARRAAADIATAAHCTRTSAVERYLHGTVKNLF